MDLVGWLVVLSRLQYIQYYSREICSFLVFCYTGTSFVFSLIGIQRQNNLLMVPYNQCFHIVLVFFFLM